MWCVELTSCSESDAFSIDLTKYLRDQFGETIDLWILGDFLMKLGDYKKAEKYYKILEEDLDLPEQHVDRAKIYNRLGIIRREQNELNVAIDYFQKAVQAAPSDSSMQATTTKNMQVTQDQLRRKPRVFLGKRLASSDVISKSLVTNDISTPILENNLGLAAYYERNFEQAIKHYEKAISIMKQSEMTYIHELSCVYNNRGAVEYDQGNYIEAKNYFLDAALTLLKFSSNHPWMDDYKLNLSFAQNKIHKKQRVE